MTTRKVKLGEDTEFSLTPKVLAGIAALIASAIGYHYWLIAQIEEAKVSPAIGKGVYMIDPADPAAKETYPPSRQEYNMKDELTRSEIMNYMERTDERLDRLEGK